MTDHPQQFASDNYAGICPEAWDSMQAANQGHAVAYGEDAWTAKAADAFRALFETDCEVFFAFNGTAANALALSSLCQNAAPPSSFRMAPSCWWPPRLPAS